jgi:hypothetical protein
LSWLSKADVCAAISDVRFVPKTDFNAFRKKARLTPGFRFADWANCLFLLRRGGRLGVGLSLLLVALILLRIDRRSGGLLGFVLGICGHRISF